MRRATKQELENEQMLKNLKADPRLRVALTHYWATNDFMEFLKNTVSMAKLGDQASALKILDGVYEGKTCEDVLKEHEDKDPLLTPELARMHEQGLRMVCEGIKLLIKSTPSQVE